MPQNGEIQLSSYSDAMENGWMHYIMLGVRIYELVHLLTYLFTYTVGSVRIKLSVSPKRLKIELKLLNGLYKIGHMLSIAAKMYDLE